MTDRDRIREGELVDSMRAAVARPGLGWFADQVEARGDVSPAELERHGVATLGHLRLAEEMGLRCHCVDGRYQARTAMLYLALAGQALLDLEQAGQGRARELGPGARALLAYAEHGGDLRQWLLTCLAEEEQ